jgi:hypothetical protein
MMSGLFLRQESLGITILDLSWMRFIMESLLSLPLPLLRLWLSLLRLWLPLSRLYLYLYLYWHLQRLPYPSDHTSPPHFALYQSKKMPLTSPKSTSVTGSFLCSAISKR